jgi:hypothetical protein
MRSTSALAPIAIFAFKRPAHLRRALASLSRNPEFEHSELHIYCDGARHSEEESVVAETRSVASEWPHPAKTLHLSASNQGLASSMIAGVSSLCTELGRVIVVEDDLVVSQVFLDFMNRSLNHYSEDPQVMQISGHMFPPHFPRVPGDVIFLPFTTSWGWATWSRAWSFFDSQMSGYQDLIADSSLRRSFDLNDSYPYFSMLKKQRAGTIDSWAIRWYLSVFLQRGLVAYPKESLVSNEGFDGSGTHCGSHEFLGRTNAGLTENKLENLNPAILDNENFKIVGDYLRAQNTIWLRGQRFLRRKLG